MCKIHACEDSKTISIKLKNNYVSYAEYYSTEGNDPD
jgi:hypothetical protein